MKTFKTFDLFGQLITLATLITGSLFPDAGAVTSISLLIFAGLQIISLLVHTTVSKEVSWKSPLRKFHVWGMLTVFGILVYGMVKPTTDKYDMSSFAVMSYALIPAAAVALFYTIIILLEYQKIKKQ